jgi:hypothetical protein
MSNRDDYIDDTIAHIDLVAASMLDIARKICVRGDQHDRSKFSAVEADIYEHVVPKLKTLAYGSDAYKETVKELGPALAHHYQNNSHHPEHYPDGINDMDLLDLIEMVCDWMAAVKRTKNGDINKSLVINKKRFGVDDQLYKIIDNTVRRMEA